MQHSQMIHWRYADPQNPVGEMDVVTEEHQVLSVNHWRYAALRNFEVEMDEVMKKQVNQ